MGVDVHVTRGSLGEAVLAEVLRVSVPTRCSIPMKWHNPLRAVQKRQMATGQRQIACSFAIQKRLQGFV